jgi:hypothetical protein
MALYDEDFNVQRQMLCWGMFGAWVARSYEGAVDNVVEPLRSYVSLIRTLEEAREKADASESSSSSAQPAPPPQLAFNSPARICKEQAESAMRLFYWGAIHGDDDSRPMSRDNARRALEFYILFGHVVLKKRSYKFQASEKRAVAS